MFNALTSDELIAGMGRVLRTAAGATELPDEYARSQMLSAYSISRLLAAEQRASVRLLRWLRSELCRALASSPDRAAASARARIEQAADAAAIGDALVELLAELRRDGREPELRGEIHAVLRTMADLELAALSGLGLDAREGS
jgi:hypothetical protein